MLQYVGRQVQLQSWLAGWLRKVCGGRASKLGAALQRFARNRVWFGGGEKCGAEKNRIWNHTFNFF